MQSFFEKLKLALSDKAIFRKILFTLGALIVFRLLTTIPIPGIDIVKLEAFFANNQFLGLLNLFSGGGLSNLSIVMLGVGPYITGSIIMQLLTMMSPKLKAMYHEDGEAGRARFTQYSRRLTVPLALLQAFGFLTLLNRQGVLGDLSGFDMGLNIMIVTAGSLFLMWLGEVITEFGIGNGLSLLIFGGIIANLPTQVAQLTYSFDPSQIPLYVGFVAIALFVIFAVVLITEAERAVPVTYAKQVRGMKVYGGLSTYLPLRVNQGGVIPIIFALSILLFPQMILNFLTTVSNVTIADLASKGLTLLSNGWFHALAYFFLVFVFTYFYTAVTFEPEAIATNLQKNGAFIPGVRPGQSTAEHLSKIVTRITLVGAVFLGLIAVLPLVMQAVTGIAALSIGGTGLLIVVSVVLDLVKKIEAQVSMREY